jgi:hypothetical protein
VPTAQYNLAWGEALSLQGISGLCPVGATQNSRLMLPFQGKYFSFIRPLGLCPRLSGVVPLALVYWFTGNWKNLGLFFVD